MPLCEPEVVDRDLAGGRQRERRRGDATACRRPARCRSPAPARRPSVPGASGKRRPASSPLTTTSSRSGVRSGPGRSAPTVRPRPTEERVDRTGAGSGRPAVRRAPGRRDAVDRPDPARRMGAEAHLGTLVEPGLHELEVGVGGVVVDEQHPVAAGGVERTRQVVDRGRRAVHPDIELATAVTVEVDDLHQRAKVAPVRPPPARVRRLGRDGGRARGVPRGPAAVRDDDRCAVRRAGTCGARCAAPGARGS